MKKVQGYQDLYRDDTGAIINTGVSEYEKYLSLKQSKEAEMQRIDKLEGDINEIKNMLEVLLKKL